MRAHTKLESKFAIKRQAERAGLAVEAELGVVNDALWLTIQRLVLLLVSGEASCQGSYCGGYSWWRQGS